MRPISEKTVDCSPKNKSSGSKISFHGITYSVTHNTRMLQEDANETQKILDDVSGIMLPGLNAIMGPTDSGKTSLLDILACCRKTKSLQGTVLVNGEKQPRNFKCISGYIVQVLL